jgi:hypothetical protein
MAGALNVVGAVIKDQNAKLSVSSGAATLSLQN